MWYHIWYHAWYHIFDICLSLAGAYITSTQSAEEHADQDMDYEKEFDFADQGPLTDMDMDQVAQIMSQILVTLLESIPSCMNAADIEQLLQEIPVQAPVAVPVRTVQPEEAKTAGNLPPLDVEAGNVFLQS